MPSLRRTPRPAALFAGALAALAAACSGGAGADAPRRVVLVVLDALHARHLSCYGGPAGLTPNVDRLAERGVRFDRALSNTTWTLPSTTSLLTGRFPESHGVVTNHHRLPADEVTLAERFRRAGWRTGAFVQMVYAGASFGLDRGFETFAAYGGKGKALRDRMPAEVLAWLDRAGGERAFLYLHFRRPHGKYNPLPAALARLDEGCPLADGSRDAELEAADLLGQHELDPAARAHVEHLYRANLATVDRRLAPILERCLADPATLVVLTSDHGEGLGEHGFYGHGNELHPECIDVPLLVAGPGIEPRVDREPACTADVAPTLLELCGLDAAPGPAIDGTSLVPRLLGAAAPERWIPVAARYTRSNVPLAGVVRGRWIAVVPEEGEPLVRDRAAPGAPPAEPPADLVAEAAERARASRERGLAHARRAGDPAELTPEEEEELRALGYVR